MSIGLAIIGMGGIAVEHVYAARQAGLALRCVAEPGPFNRQIIEPGTAVFSDWRKVLKHPGVDAVSICTPHDLHLEMAVAALEAGKHVLTEKPIADRIEPARTIVETAERCNRVFMVEMTHRFYPAVRHACDNVMASGRLGRLYAVEDRIIEYLRPNISGWYFTKARSGGGVALTNGIHMLDRIRHVTGQKLRFHNGTAANVIKRGDVEDTAAMFLSLEDGTPVQFLAAFAKGDHAHDDELTLYGQLGTLRIWAWRGWRFESADGSAEERQIPCRTRSGPSVNLGVVGAVAEFAAAIRENRKPVPPPRDVLDAQQIIHDFYQHLEGSVVQQA